MSNTLEFHTYEDNTSRTKVSISAFSSHLWMGEYNITACAIKNVCQMCKSIGKRKEIFN